jgi:hypothetical protein
MAGQAMSTGDSQAGFRPASLDSVNFLLDGVGAGIFGAITPLVIADLMRGTGRYKVAQGAVATVQGVGMRGGAPAQRSLGGEGSTSPCAARTAAAGRPRRIK